MNHSTIYSKNSTRGFTLVELMVVVGIMVAVFAFAIPAFQGIGEGVGMKTSVEKLRVTMSLARQHAITKRQNVYVLFPDERIAANDIAKPFRSYAVYFESLDGNEEGFLTNWKRLPEGIIFDPDERPTTNIYKLQAGGLTLDVTVDLPEIGNGQTVKSILFTPTGTPPRVQPYSTIDPEIFITEGWFEGNSTTPTFQPNRQIWSTQIYRYTGLNRISEI